MPEKKKTIDGQIYQEDLIGDMVPSGVYEGWYVRFISIRNEYFLVEFPPKSIRELNKWKKQLEDDWGAIKLFSEEEQSGILVGYPASRSLNISFMEYFKSLGHNDLELNFYIS